MNESQKLKSALFVSVSFCYFAFGCSDTPAGVDQEEEDAAIPWSQISGKIVYSRTVVSNDAVGGRLYVIDGESRTVSLAHEGGPFYQIAWKYDGTSIAFVRYMSWYQLLTVLPDGSGESILYPVDAHQAHPAWSRDGRLAYWFNGEHPSCETAECGYSIFVDDTPFFTERQCNMSRPAWSPDNGSLVISISDSTSQGSLYRVSLSDTTTSPLLLAQGPWNTEIFYDPVYSPDGSKIAFVKAGSALGNSLEIWTVDADGTNPTRLTGGFDDHYPTWSPDGAWIGFIRMGAPQSQIFLVSAGGGDTVTQVTQNGAEFLSWIP